MWWSSFRWCLPLMVSRDLLTLKGAKTELRLPRVQLYGSQEDSPNYDQRQCKADFASPDGLVQNRLINTRSLSRRMQRENPNLFLNQFLC